MGKLFCCRCNKHLIDCGIFLGLNVMLCISWFYFFLQFVLLKLSLFTETKAELFKGTCNSKMENMLPSGPCGRSPYRADT